MNILDIIETKRTKHELSPNQIDYVIKAYVQNKIPDYQFAALIMAININGLTPNETYNFTKAFVESGNTIDLSDVKGIKIDKHSTGGVGDKVSVIICPILAACGLKVAKMSGKGLAHTGGTIDKLNSIGVNCDLSVNQCKRVLQKHNIFIASQTEDIVPADKKCYDLRNSTSTVDSIPLIATSIASKKIAMKTDYVFIDVKVGDGGFCQNITKAIKLSKIIIYLLKRFKRKCIAHITNMNQPLGRAIGNTVEMKATIEFLQNKPESEDIKELIYEFASDILVSTKLVKTKKQGLEKVSEVINSGLALKKFYEWIGAQGADVSKVSKNNFFKPKFKYEIKATRSGFIKYKSTREVGMVSFLLGAGRVTKNAPIDFQAGIYLNKVINEKVKKNETIATLYSSNKIPKTLVQRFIDNIQYSDTKFVQLPNIVKIIK